MFRWFIVGWIIIVSLGVRAQNAGDRILGVWLTEEGKAKVQIYKKDDGKYYGKIIWLKEPTYPDGRPKVDRHNPDPKLRNRPIIGLEILKGFEWDEDDNEWDDGEIYDPESGNTYDAYMWLEDENTLKIRGYIGFSMIGRTTTWKRVK